MKKNVKKCDYFLFAYEGIIPKIIDKDIAKQNPAITIIKVGVNIISLFLKSPFLFFMINCGIFVFAKAHYLNASWKKVAAIAMMERE